VLATSPDTPDGTLTAPDWRDEGFLADDARSGRFEVFADAVGSVARESIGRQRIGGYIRALLSLSPSEVTTGAPLRARAESFAGHPVDDRFLSDPPFHPDQLLQNTLDELHQTLVGRGVWVVDEFVFFTGVTEKSYRAFLAVSEQLERAYGEEWTVFRRRRDAKPRHIQRAILLHHAIDEGAPVLGIAVLTGQDVVDAGTVAAEVVSAAVSNGRADDNTRVVSALLCLSSNDQLRETLRRHRLGCVLPLRATEDLVFAVSDKSPMLSLKHVARGLSARGYEPNLYRVPGTTASLWLLPVPGLVRPAGAERAASATVVLDYAKHRKDLVLRCGWLIISGEREADRSAVAEALTAYRYAVEPAERRDRDLRDLLLDSHNHGTSASWHAHCSLVAAAYAFIVGERAVLQRQSRE
jgi:hypothetical protein